MTDRNNYLAQRLRQIRENAGFSQRGLAAAIEMPIWRVQRAEQATGLLSDTEIRRWAYGCNAGDQESELIQLWVSSLPKVVYEA